MDSRRSLEDIAIEMYHAQILWILGLGPRLELVRIGDDYFYVMPKLSGINIKEVTDSVFRTSATKDNIELALGYPVSSLDEGLRQFANRFLGSEQAMKRIKEINTTLRKYQYSIAEDAQFMVSFDASGAVKIYLIDTELFRRTDQYYESEFSFDEEMKYILTMLKGLTRRAN